jgi:hypothetical protein
VSRSFDLFVRVLVDGAREMDTGITHQDVETPERPDAMVDRVGDRRTVANIDGKRQGPSSAGADSCCDRLGLMTIEIEERN